MSVIESSKSEVALAKSFLPPLKHAWRDCVCIGMAQEILREDVQEQLRRAQREIGYHRVRFHASFHDHLGVVRLDGDGEPIYNWALFDKVYDFLVEVGFDPIVELNPMPQAIASGDQKMFDQGWGFNVTPPREWQLWEDLCFHCAAHVVERYGLPRVKNWLFECWNEPNLQPSFWSGTTEEYYQLYAACARGVKKVHEDLQVGGPASAGGSQMVTPFAKWCRENDVPLDFASYHFYPMDEYGKYPQRQGSPHKPGFAFVDEMKKTREELDAAGFEDLPSIITEWNVQHCDENGKTKWVGTSDCSRLFSAAAVLHYTIESEPYVDSFGYWVLSDAMHEAGVTSKEFGPENQHYGLMTIEGRPKAGYNAFKYLARMTGPRMEHRVPMADKPKLANLVVTDETVTVRALMWNFHMPEQDTHMWKGDLELPLPSQLADATQVRVITAKIAESQGSPYETWQAMGRPASFTRLEAEAVEAASHPSHGIHILECADGKVRVPYEVDRNEVLFIEISEASKQSAAEVNSAIQQLNQQLEYPGSKNSA